jgi:trehalose 6-phosphate phosphatase
MKSDRLQIAEQGIKKGVTQLRQEVESRFAPFLETLGRAQRAALLLDYDGTLAPLQTNREQAYPYPGVAPVLQEIMRNGRTTVIVVSGRDAADIPPLLNVDPPPEVWGVHGLQYLRPQWATEMPHLEEQTIRGLFDAERWLEYQQVAHTGEVKTGSVAVHWRGMSPSSIEDLKGRVLLGWRPVAERCGLNLLEFDGGVEIRAGEADKGEAVKSFLTTIGPEVPLAYLGDDTSDESVFRAIAGRGLSVLVRPVWRETAAQFWLKPPEELLDFLTLWLEACMRAGTSGAGTAAGVKQ